MKVLAVTGNPKRSGALADLTEMVVRGARESGADVEVVRLADLDIRHCLFCLKCRGETGPRVAGCVQEDDMACLLAKVVEADGYILACPTSGGHMNSVMGTFTERAVWTLGSPTRRILWVSGIPESRLKDRRRFAVLVTTTGLVPDWSKPFCYGAIREMASVSKGLLNAEVVGRVYGGAVIKHGLSWRSKVKAHTAGMRLAERISG